MDINFFNNFTYTRIFKTLIDITIIWIDVCTRNTKDHTGDDFNFRFFSFCCFFVGYFLVTNINMNIIYITIKTKMVYSKCFP